MRQLGLMSAAALALSVGFHGAMRAFDVEMPAFSGHTREVMAAIERDGLGRRLKPKSHPKHNARRQFERAFADFRKRVEATHSDREDPRDDKYLHSYARQMRGLRRAIGTCAA